MKKGLLIFIVFFLFGANAAWSQDESKYPEATRLINRMDQDGDGVICKMETSSIYFADDFERWDKNHDTFLDQREVAIYLKREKINLPCYIQTSTPTFE